LLEKACALLSPVSRTTLLDFQKRWDKEHPHAPFAEFRLAQDQEIRECFNMELSAFGQRVRKQYNLPTLHTDTRLP
jgi:hypothetical protein